jgi:protein-S-isoprenylcysteine O-methyltransferase Ste14
MGRGTGSGLIGFGFALAVIGAIMRYAVTVHTEGFNIHTAGVILLIVGVIMAIGGLLMLLLGGRTRSTTRESVVQTPHGQERVEEQDNWNAP